MAALQPRLRSTAAASGVEPAVRLRNFMRRFGDNTVIDGLNLSIAPGEFVALLGASGEEAVPHEDAAGAVPGGDAVAARVQRQRGERLGVVQHDARAGRL